MNEVIKHYDALIEEENDPVRDPLPLREYMDKWDGRRFVESMHLHPNAKVLELGVGTGRLAARTAPLCQAFFGIDISPKTVERARENLSAYSNVTLVCDDFMTYDFGEERFDVVYSSLTFMHIKEKEQAIQKVFSLLENHGKFVLSLDKNRDRYIDFGTRRIEIYPDELSDIQKMMSKAGFALLDEYETELAYILVAKKQK